MESATTTTAAPETTTTAAAAAAASSSDAPNETAGAACSRPTPEQATNQPTPSQADITNPMGPRTVEEAIHLAEEMLSQSGSQVLGAALQILVQREIKARATVLATSMLFIRKGQDALANWSPDVKYYNADGEVVQQYYSPESAAKRAILEANISILEEAANRAISSGDREDYKTLCDVGRNAIHDSMGCNCEEEEEDDDDDNNNGSSSSSSSNTED